MGAKGLICAILDLAVGLVIAATGIFSLLGGATGFPGIVLPLYLL